MKRLWSPVLFLIIGFAAGSGVMRSQQAPLQTQRFPQFENDDVRGVAFADSPQLSAEHASP